MQQEKDLLFIDIETYSSVDIGDCGLYKYAASDDFEILLIGYAINNGPVQTIDLASGDDLPEDFVAHLQDSNTIKVAHNASFERVCFRSVGFDIPVQQWLDTAVLAAYNGLPISLKQVSQVLDLEEKKLDTGTLLIKYFSCPVKPTKANNYRTRNMPWDNPEKWALYIEYNEYDVRSEREIYYKLQNNPLPAEEQAYYIIDQIINDNGIKVDMQLVRNCINLSGMNVAEITSKLIDLTGLANPNSVAQMKAWLEEQTGISFESLSKKAMPEVREALEGAADDVLEVLELRNQISRTSVKKYQAMANCATADNRIRGLFQFYGANRTGRWAGRLVQLQNLSKNHISELDDVRNLVRSGDFDTLDMIYLDIQDLLSQLVRTAIITEDGNTLIAADYSAIEARVVSWLAQEPWRLEVFHGDGKIYEATGSRMFGVPKEQIKKGTPLRDKAKVSELALGYGGGYRALANMGGAAMGLSQPEMIDLVKKWRLANPCIVTVWHEMEEAAMEAVVSNASPDEPVLATPVNIGFSMLDGNMLMTLPSGRSLCYRQAHIAKEGKTISIAYNGVVQITKQWGEIFTFGGKLTENAVQAMARDILADLMYRLTNLGYMIVAHVHDEVIIEVPKDNAEKDLTRILDQMTKPPTWCIDLPLKGDGYITPYYKKD